MANQSSSLNEFKANFTTAYNEKFPHTYFSIMEDLEYQIPENAKPTINFFIAQIKKRYSETVSILDLGCSYGVLSALVRFDLPLKSLYRRYQASKPADASRQSEADWYASQSARGDVRFYGIDTSANAIEFATNVVLLDAGVAVDLEDQLNTPSSLASLPQQIDLVVSTGCVGYITNKTFKKVLLHIDPSKPPIIASFVLRAFDYSEIAETLAEHGFRTTKLADTTFVQRRFRDSTEQAHILSLLMARSGHPQTPTPPENDGYYHAELFVSIHQDAEPAILDDLRQTWSEL